MAGAWFIHGPVWPVWLVHGLYRPVPGTTVVWTIYTTVASVVLKTIYTTVVSVVPRHDGRVRNICLYTFDVMQLRQVMPRYAFYTQNMEMESGRVILKYAGTMAPMAPISLVVGGVKPKLNWCHV